jgi:DNA topoisomerase-6 subunit B
MASVWVPFTSESKEAIADYDEIRKQMRLALQECGRKLGTYLRRRQRMRREAQRRSTFERYIGEIARCCHEIAGTDAEALYTALQELAMSKTAEADQLLDDEGRVVEETRRLAADEGVIIVEDRQPPARPDAGPAPDGLFQDGAAPASRSRRRKRKKRP